METGKPGLASVPVHVSFVTTQAEKRMNIQVPLTAVYIHTVPPAAAEEPLRLAIPPLYSKETPPFLTLHLANGLQPLPGLSLTAPAAKPKSAGKHMCPHCGRDCLKPSVLEKHLRCHTGERPYPCSTCGVSFKTQSNLYKHRRTQAHARLSSESEQSSLGSQDSMSSSRETCTFSSSLDEQREELGSQERKSAPPAPESTTASSPTKVHCVQMQGSVSEQNESRITCDIPETNRRDGPKEEPKQQMDYTKSLSLNRHLPLQRQEATLFSEQWGSSVSKGKSLSHESTDSGFSDSPGGALLDHSMDSLTESSKEHVEKSISTSSDRVHCEQEPQNTARKQEQELLVQRISKLISENTAVVEDKQLENVRPRKTVLSKQGSIDLPMPYTYKNSFHFDMKISPTQNIGLKRYSRSGLSSSLPSTVEHAPLTRSHSLPFNLTLMQPERSSSASPHQRDNVKTVLNASSGQIPSTDFSRRPVNQNSSAHRPLVRQTAVDCNHARDGPFSNSSVEEVCTGSLSCDGDGGEICGEPNTRKFRRKRAQKFAYNKWYMYGGGTFKKLYDSQTGANNSMFEGKNCSTNLKHEVVRAPVVPKEAATISNSSINFTNSRTTAGHPYAGPSVVSSVGFTLQKCHLISTNSSSKVPPRRNLSLSVQPFPAVGSLLSHKTETGQPLNVPTYSETSSQLCEAHVPSDRKKQRTDDKTSFSVEMETDPNTLTHPATTVTSVPPLQDTIQHRNPKHIDLQGALFPPSVPAGTSTATSISVAAKTTFLPKYQLKLPNTHGETLESTSHVGKSKGTDECPLSPSVLPTTSDQTFPSRTTCEKTREGPSSSPLIQTYTNSSVKISGFTENRLVLPGTIMTLCGAETSQHSQSLTCSPEVLHRQFATTTVSTSCLQDSPDAACTVMQSVPLQPAQRVTPAANLSLTTAKYSTSVATITAASHHQPRFNPSLLKEQLSTTPESVNFKIKAHFGPDDPVVPCSIGSLDQSAQSVFHVNTADFQICFQMISDEQLALIAPQIEHASDPSQSQTCDIKATLLQSYHNKSLTFATMELSNKMGNCEQPETQKETDAGKSLHMFSTERITPLVSERHNDTSTSLAESVFSEGPSQQAQKSSHGSLVTHTQSSAARLMSSASLRDVKSGGMQTVEGEQVLFQNHCADSMVLQGEKASQTVPGRHKLSMSSLSARTVHQKSIDGELKYKQWNHKNSVKTSDQGQTHRGKMLESGGWVRHVSRDAGSNGSDISGSKTPEQLDPLTSIYSSQSKPAVIQSTRVEASDSYPPTLEANPLQLQDRTSSEHSDIRVGQSAYVHDVAAVCPSSRSPTVGLVEGASLEEHAAQEEQKIKAAPESSDWRTNVCEVKAEMDHRGLEGHHSAAATGKETKQVIKTDKVPDSNCTHVLLPDVSALQGDKTKVQVDSLKNVRLSEQHLPCCSQSESGVLTSPAAGPQEAPSLLKFCPLQRKWDNIVQNQQIQASCESNSGPCGFTQVCLSETQNLLSRMEPILPSFPLIEENKGSLSISAQQDRTSVSNHGTTGSFSHFFTSESPQHTRFSTDFKTLSFMQFNQASEEGRTSAGLTVTQQTSKDKLNPGSLSEPFTHLDSDCGKPDTNNKYQSVFMAGPIYSYQSIEGPNSSARPAPICKDYTEGPSSAVRPVPVCQDHIEDTSSSDDEGKLIIEL